VNTLRLKKIPPDIVGDDNYLLGVRIPSPAPFSTKKIGLRRTMLFPRTPKCNAKMDRKHASTLTPTLPNIESMKSVRNNPAPHTQTTRQKQPKPKKQPNPNPTV